VTPIERRGRIWSTLLASGFGGLGLKTIGGGFIGLGLKTRAEVPRRNGRHVAVSGSSRQGEATGEEARWPSDEDYLRLDHTVLGSSGSTQNIYEQKWNCVIALLNRMSPQLFHFSLSSFLVSPSP
jgi:hypothetical protein